MERKVDLNDPRLRMAALEAIVAASLGGQIAEHELSALDRNRAIIDIAGDFVAENFGDDGRQAVGRIGAIAATMSERFRPQG